MRKSIIRIDNVWNNSDAKFAEYAVKLHLKEKKLDMAGISKSDKIFKSYQDPSLSLADAIK